MIPTLQFGKTGHESTRTLFGAAAFSRVDQPTADKTMELLEQYGINHIDTAASYGDSELRLAPWLRQNRDKVFLATKTGKRTYDEARDSILLSLQRLGVDHVDLLQLHNLTDPAEWEIAMGPGGALEAAIEAWKAGLTRYIGVTGHGVIAPSIHLRSLDRFPFDSVLLPYDYPMIQNATYAADFEKLVATCAERGVAVQTIKGITMRPWGEHDPHTASTWYEPLRDATAIDTAIKYVFARPSFFLNTVGDVTILPTVLEAASRYDGSVPSDADMEALVAQEKMAPLFV